MVEVEVTCGSRPCLLIHLPEGVDGENSFVPAETTAWSMRFFVFLFGGNVAWSCGVIHACLPVVLGISHTSFLTLVGYPGTFPGDLIVVMVVSEQDCGFLCTAVYR